MLNPPYYLNMAALMEMTACKAWSMCDKTLWWVRQPTTATKQSLGKKIQFTEDKRPLRCFMYWVHSGTIDAGDVVQTKHTNEFNVDICTLSRSRVVPNLVRDQIAKSSRVHSFCNERTAGCRA